jgi:hypothetical protein
VSALFIERGASKSRQNVRTPASPLHFQRSQPMEMIGVAVNRHPVEAEGGQALKQDRHRHLEFKPGQWRADAEMNAAAEADMG